MGKAFKKGDRVTHFGSWDDRGTMYYTDAVVMSCGPKRMTLVCEATGAMMGRDFRPAVGTLSDACTHNGATLLRLMDRDAQAFGLSAATEYIRHKLADAEMRVKLPAYSMQTVKSRTSELHEPRVMARPNF